MENPDYKNLLALLALVQDANNRLAQMQTDADTRILEILDECKNDYIMLQASITDAEASIEMIARRHPEWFANEKTVKTLYGTVRSTSTTKLVAANPRASIALIKANDYAPAELIRTTEELNLEALEDVSDETLADYGITREKSESITIKPAKLEMGKAIKAADKADKKKGAKAA